MMRIAMLNLLLAVCAAAAGCGGYQLTGKVVEGPVSSIAVVDQHDPRLQQPGIGGATIQVTVDPRQPGRKRLPAQHASGDGSFGIPVGEMGAGFLQYEVQIVAQLGGYQSAHNTLPLPGGDKRLLITLTPGRDTGVPGGYQTDDFISETMRMGEPFLRE